MLWNINPKSELKNTHTYNYKFYVIVSNNKIHVINTHKQTNKQLKAKKKINKGRYCIYTKKIINSKPIYQGYKKKKNST